MKAKRTFMTDSFTISQESHYQGWNMPYTHFHDSYELYILESGTRAVTIDGKEYTVCPHDVTLFNKNIPHTSRGNTPFSGICIHILDRFIDFYFTAEAKKHLLKCFDYTVIHLDCDAFTEIKNTADKFLVKDTNNFMKFVRIMEILCTAAERASEPPPELKTQTLSTAQRVIQYVDDNYIFINSITDIMEHFGISESYVFKIFKQSLHISPKQYLYSLKLNNACHWLENQEGTIKSIAFRSGFDCYEYFIRLFKEKMGCTPSEYRKRFIKNK